MIKTPPPPAEDATKCLVHPEVMSQPRLETSQHLYQSPKYRAKDGTWHASYRDAVKHSGQVVTWNPAAVLSILSHGYVCGDITLLNEITRQPWLSQVDADGEPSLEEILPHGTARPSRKELSVNFLELLTAETCRVCRNRDEIYIPLSGGSDSRVLASVLFKLVREGRISTKPIAVTWGMADCADVAYGQAVARALNFDWEHAKIRPENLMQNVELAAAELGCLVSPIHLKGMTWFERAKPDAIVLGGCYGNAIGRGLSSSVHILEERPLRPLNYLGLLSPELESWSRLRLDEEIVSLHRRAPGQPCYVTREHERVAHKIRGVIAHSMSFIYRYCTVYQMLTDPKLYSLVWSVHPTLRFDNIYADIFSQFDQQLAQVPLAGSNCCERHLRKVSQDYRGWIQGPLYESLVSALDPDWFAATGLFQASAVRQLKAQIQSGDSSYMAYNIISWLASLRCFVSWIEGMGIRVELSEECCADRPMRAMRIPRVRTNKGIHTLKQSKAVSSILKKLRRAYYTCDAHFRY